MRVVSTLHELDDVLSEVEAAARISDDAMRAVFARFRMEYPPGLPADPHSAEYRDAQLALYRSIAGKDYRVANEASSFIDVDSATRRPFPYYTGSCATVGTHLMAMGHAIRCLDLPAGASVLEFGPGWGNTTLALAMAGFKVTAVDIEPRFCELIRRRAQLAGVHIEVVNADFAHIREIAQPVDAILFFECFHHASDHVALMAAFDAAVKPGGKVLFAAEPILADFPVPWGLRLDGESLWAIRQNGWLELGYREDYFLGALRRHGWLGRRHDLPTLPWATFIEARRAGDWALRFPGDAPQLFSQAGTPSGGCLQARGEAGAFLLYGPYAQLHAGRWMAQVALAQHPDSPNRGRCRLEVCSGDTMLASAEVDLSGASPLALEFEAPRTLEGVEVRLMALTPATAAIRELALLPL